MDREKLLELYKKYNLGKTDVYKHQHYVIITRQGIEKIAAKENIQFGAPTIYRDSNQDVAIVGDAKRGNKIIWSTGEASPNNCKAPYPFAMAEKRLKDRLVLKLIDAYQYSIYSDSEADNFKKQ